MKRSIVARKYIFDQMRANNNNSFNIEMTKKLVKAARDAHKNWELDKERKKLDKTVTDLKNQRFLISKDVEDLEKKCESLKKATTGIGNECFECMQLTEKKHGMSCFIKGNCLKRISDECRDNLRTTNESNLLCQKKKEETEVI